MQKPRFLAAMKRGLLVSLGFSFIILINSCGPSGGERQKRIAKGNKFYGGTLHINELTPVENLYPFYIYDNVSATIADQIYDGLIKFNPKNLAIIPAIASRWEIDSNGLLYTFHLKKGVFFQDDPCFQDGKGRRITADDFKYSFEALCTAGPDNVVYGVTFRDNVIGANEYYEDSKKGKPMNGLRGVKAINDSTLQIRLTKVNPLFLDMLAGCAGYVIPKEAVEKYGKNSHVGAGPFVYSSGSDSSKVVLVRNPNYYKFDSLGNQLPFLDSVIISFIPNKQEEFKYFQQGKLDYIKGVPSSQVDRMVEQQISDFQHKPPKYVLTRVPEMLTDYYAFNISKPPFNDVRVRKAFNYAINRNKLVNDVLEGEAFAPGTHGIIPPTFLDYPEDSVVGDTLNIKLAQKLLADAGYKDGKDFPSITLELNSGGGVNTSVAVELQKELLNNLNINLNFNTVPFSRKIDDERFGRFTVIRSGWIADYPSPAVFLMLFYGGNVPDSVGSKSSATFNVTRYKNPEFDRLFNLGRSSSNPKVANHYYMEAEKLAMADAPIAVLWYGQNYSLSRWVVKNLYSNPMNLLDLSYVYIDQTAAAAQTTKDSAQKK